MKKIIVLMVSILFSTVLFAQKNHVAVKKNTPLSPQQVQEIQKVVHDYLISNPEVLVEASQILQTRAAEKAQQESLTAVSQVKDKLFNNPDSPVVNPQGTVTLVEFFDYQCGHCKAMESIITNLSKNPAVKIIFKELPIFGGNSQFAAQAALAANKQSKYQDFHSALLKEDSLTKDKVLEIAKKVGIDPARLQQDINSAEINKEIRANLQLAQKLKLIGTPTFVIANKDFTKFDFVPGRTTQEDLQKRIDALK